MDFTIVKILKCTVCHSLLILVYFNKKIVIEYSYGFTFFSQDPVNPIRE